MTGHPFVISPGFDNSPRLCEGYYNQTLGPINPKLPDWISNKFGVKKPMNNNWWYLYVADNSFVISITTCLIPG